MENERVLTPVVLTEAREPEDATFHTFSSALQRLKSGLPMTRLNWNGRGQFVELQHPDPNSKMSLPYLYLTTVQGDRVPWVASQTDLLMDDWVRYQGPRENVLAGDELGQAALMAMLAKRDAA